MADSVMSSQQQHPLSMADLPPQLIAAHIGPYLTAVDLLRCYGVSHRLYRAFAVTSLAELTAVSNNTRHRAKRARSCSTRPVTTDTHGHLAWADSCWRPTNIEFMHVFDDIDWNSLRQLQHLDLSRASVHLGHHHMFSLAYELIPNHCQQLRTLVLPLHKEGPSFCFTRLDERVALNTLTRLENLQLDGVGGFMDNLGPVISKNPQLQTLALFNCMLSPVIDRLPTQLRVLGLPRMHPQWLQALHDNVAMLEELSLAGEERDDWTHAVSELLSTCTALQRLTLTDFHVTLPTLEVMSHLQALRSLHLLSCSFDIDSVDGLLLLRQVQSLVMREPADHLGYEVLDEDRRWSPTPAMLQALLRLPSLTSLQCDRLRVDHIIWLREMPSLPHFQTLKLDGEGIFSSPMGVVECKELCRVLPHLTELQLPADCFVDNECMDLLIRGLPELISLSFRSAHHLTAEGLCALVELTQLRCLDVSLRDSPIGLQQLLYVVGQCPTITNLTLACDDITFRLDDRTLLEFIPRIRNLTIDCNAEAGIDLTLFVQLLNEDNSEAAADTVKLVTLCAELPLLEELSLNYSMLHRDLQPILLQTFTEHSYRHRATSPAHFDPCQLYSRSLTRWNRIYLQHTLRST